MWMLKPWPVWRGVVRFSKDGQRKEEILASSASWSSITERRVILSLVLDIVVNAAVEAVDRMATRKESRR